MRYQPGLIVLQAAGVAGSDYAALLMDQGYDVRAFESPSAFARLHEPHGAVAILLVGDAQPLDEAMACIRRVDATTPVVVVRAGADVALRVLALQAGADACYASDVPAIELAAALRAVTRRLAQPGARGLSANRVDWTSILRRSHRDVSPGWRLLDGGSTLVSPSNDCLRLTASERVLMVLLIGMAGRPLHRSDMAEAAWPRHAAVGIGANKPRSVDVLVSRLKRKAERQGMVLPVMAVRRWGYMFLGDVIPSSVAMCSD